jgi:hypothetical protein
VNYRVGDCEQLAALMARVLEDRFGGEQVFFASRSIPLGDDFAQAIHDALHRCSVLLAVIGPDWLTATDEAGRPLIERDDDWVRREIRIALNSGVRVIPVLIGGQEEMPHLHAMQLPDDIQDITRKQYVRLHYQNTNLDDLFSRLAETNPELFTRESLGNAGLQLGYVREKASGFVGRDSAFAEFTAFLGAHPSGHVIVEGDPGTGKTSLLAEVVLRNNWPAYFNIAAQGISSVLGFMQSMHAQFAERYGVRLAPPGAGDDADGRYLSILLEQTADRLQPGDKLVIVIDALDEADHERPGTNVLFLPTALQAGLYLLVSRRSRTAPLQVDGPWAIIDLMDRPAESRKDAARFIQNSLTRPVLAARLGRGADQEQIVARLLDRSELNFMYLVYVLRDIEDGRMGAEDVNGLPLGLHAYYERHLQRMLSRGGGAALSFQTIYALAAIREPVPASLLAGGLHVTELEVVRLLADWAQFLRIAASGGPSTYSFYHQGFCDFLMQNDTVRAAGVDLAEINSMVGHRLIDRLGLDLDR